MPRFYFDYVDRRVIPDEEGQHFPDLSAASHSAKISALEIMSNAIWQGRLPIDECIRIKDDQGRLLNVIRFRDLVAIGQERQPAE